MYIPSHVTRMYDMKVIHAEVLPSLPANELSSLIHVESLTDLLPLEAVF